MSNPSPELTSPGRPTIAGDYTDDDAEVMESLTKDAATPPTGRELPTTPLPPAIIPKAMTRLMTGTVIVQAGWAPILLLPADPNRKSLHLWAASATATDYIRVSDDAGKVQSVGGSALLYSGQPDAFPPDHTGPVWVSAPDGIGPVTVSFIAVTN